MNENLDLTELLKDCPKGAKFYSTIYGEVEFLEINTVNDYPIGFLVGNNAKRSVTKQGLHIYNAVGECTLFPSKDQRNWHKWQRPFKDGDIVATENGFFIGIIKVKNDVSFETYCAINNVGSFTINTPYYFGRFATEEEKQMLFEAIEENGYKWDSNKKELIKFEPKFDISTLQPFDKVLVRINDDNEWHVSLFSHMSDYTSFCYKFVTIAGRSDRQIVPYNEETKHLLGTIEAAPEKYINW